MFSELIQVPKTNIDTSSNMHDQVKTEQIKTMKILRKIDKYLLIINLIDDTYYY